jgi:hypothetical protein
MMSEKHQQVEYLWLGLAGFPATAQFKALGIYFDVREE